ncbi:MAG: Ldh family oxidoreductase [Rhizobiaceae bacterium]|nr:Ldh family oxidoreductase [Rhizobiaceae bacterium]
MTETLSLDDIERLSFDVLRRVGASEAAARSLAAATAAAEAEGQRNVGLAHLPDYLDGYRHGRIRGGAVPNLVRPAPAMFVSDANGGLAHQGFDLAADDLAAAAQTLGLALFTQRNAFTCGAVGYFAHRLAMRGLVALATTNGPALMTGSGGGRPVFCTNPLAFAVPRGSGRVLLIDQSSSATAYVNLRAAADAGQPIPEGWAVDAEGLSTTDPREAMRGALLAFGGSRGANIALMVELLSAGLSGANWSVDAPRFDAGAESPGAGLFVLAIHPNGLGHDLTGRVDTYLERLSHDYGVHVPGEAKEAHRENAIRDGIEVPADLLIRLRSYMD